MGQCVCFQTPQQLLKLGLDLTTSLISCMPREHLFIGMLEKVWKKESFLKLVKTWQLWKKIMKKLVWIPLMMKEKLEKNINYFSEFSNFQALKKLDTPLFSLGSTTKYFFCSFT